MPLPEYRPEYAEIARRVCKTFGASDFEVAQALGDDLRARDIRRFRLESPEFNEACTAGLADASKHVVHAVYRLATGYHREVVKVVATKTGPKRIEETQEVPPNLDACRYWLNNRLPDQWADKQVVDVTTRDVARSARDLSRAELERIAASGAAVAEENRPE